MRLSFLFILLTVCLSVRASDVASCRRLLMHVVEKKGAMTADDLTAFAAEPLGTNPSELAKFPDQATHYAFAQAFAAHLKGPEGMAVAQALRAEARRLAEERGRVEGRRETARTETQVVVHPVVVRTLDNIGPPGFFTREGRRFATFVYGRSQIGILDIATGALSFVSPDHGALYGTPQYFEHDNHGWLVLRGENGVSTHGVEGGRGDFFSVTEGMQTYIQPRPFVIDGKPWLAVVADNPKELIIEPARPSTETHKTARGFPVHDLSVSHGSSGPLLLATNPTFGTFKVVDPKSMVITDRVEDSGGIQMLLYHRNGEPRLLRYHGGSLSILDGKGEVLRQHEFKWVRHAQLHIDDQRAQVLAFVEAPTLGLAMIDLDTHTVRHAGSVPPESGAASYFRFRGHEYVTYGTKAGEIVIVDLADPSSVVKKKITSHVPAILAPYEAPTGVDAILVNGDGAPGAILQLIGPPDRVK